MPLKMKAVALDESDSSEFDGEEEETARKRIRLIREQLELEQESKRFSGGIKVSTESEVKDNSTSASLSVAEKKGLKEVAELERELDLKNTFSKETNRRDEDAEMNKYIEEQIRLKREAEKKERQKLEVKKRADHDDSELSEIFTLPAAATDKIDDILLHSLSKNLAPSADERSEAMLSSQMLNGIPEVDLGITERIRTIEATEEAKLRLAASSGSSKRNLNKSSKTSTSIPVNFSSNFQQHRYNRDSREGELKTTRPERRPHNNTTNTITEAVVHVGEEPTTVEYKLPSTGGHPPPKGKSSDDYCVSKFKKSNRF